MIQVPIEFADISEKNNRARQLTAELEKQVELFLSSLAGGTEAGGTEWEVRSDSVVLKSKARIYAPPSIRILTGEVLFHLRTLLDHLAWQLALLATDKPGSKTEFPVFKDRKIYLSNLRKKIGDLPSEIAQAIEAEQPFNRDDPESDPLWLLHQLCNYEKHRMVSVIHATYNDYRIDDAKANSIVEFSGGTGEGEGGILSVRKRNDCEPLDLSGLSCSIGLAIANTDNGKNLHLLETIHRCGYRVSEIVLNFQRFFR